ncbi:LuxR C-terminal-related transcriptional regulator [Modestobacter versicolor]|uniref:DNA-binding NarL/FixJ family response regulator n=1 Tax=Modestobacter versicolor TaxID=429133 RepID=A0A323VB18_9ACTN|nr:response regulator transcription factor [Modestobacter versicolor]MBB3677221.1 DNA-binding NarL/FixJ family response regulator [Modestobacter versicolor]PZA20416.1 DNA-binding response regulator [Modestobacter versicolor]
MAGDAYLGMADQASPGVRAGLPGTAPAVPAGGPAARAAVRVLVCDDHEVLRHGVRAVLLRAPDLLVVGEAEDAAEALELATRTRPDVTVVGLGVWGPVVQGLVRSLTGMGVRVVLLGEPGAGSDLVDALQAGASGYVHTTVSPQRLVDGVRAVAQGETVLDEAATGELLHRLDDTPRHADGARSAFSGALTARQMAVSRLVAEGLTNAEIAERLDVSRATVKGHITVALRRLGLRDRTQLAIQFHRATGLARGEGPAG